MEHSKNIQEISKLWLDDKKKFVKRSTTSAYVLLLENHILPAFGTSQNITEEEAQNFVFNKLEKGLSKKTISDILIVLKMILKYGDKQKLITYKPFDIRFPTEHQKPNIEVLTKADQAKIMKHIQAHFTFKNLGVYICLSTGLRIGEICALTWDDLNIDKGMLSINKTIQRIYTLNNGIGKTELIIDQPKTKNSIREIPMSKELCELIAPLKKVVNSSYYILTNHSKPTEPRTYRNHYKLLMKELNIPFLKFHGLRHSFATRCIESKCDYKTVSVLLGHANISTTLNLYVHPNAEQKKKVIEQMFESLHEY